MDDQSSKATPQLSTTRYCLWALTFVRLSLGIYVGAVLIDEFRLPEMMVNVLTVVAMLGAPIALGLATYRVWRSEHRSSVVFAPLNGAGCAVVVVLDLLALMMSGMRIYQ